MSAATIEQAVEDIYASLQNDNKDIDAHIANLKKLLAAAGKKEVMLEPARLAHNNHAGRKLLKSYFRRKGVAVVFEKPAA